jgi:hypothetical protein
MFKITFQAASPFRLLTFIIMIATASSAMAQSEGVSQTQSTTKVNPARPHPPISADQLFESQWGAFFGWVLSLDQISDRREKEGQPESASGWHKQIQLQTGLNDEQMELLRKIAKEYTDGLDQRGVAIGEAAQQYRKAHPEARGTTYLPPEVLLMIDQQRRFSLDEVGKLVAGIGGKAFSRVDAYRISLFEKNKQNAPGPDSSSPANNSGGQK